MSFPEMQLIIHIIGHWLPRMIHVRPSAKVPTYEELVIPERLNGFEVGLVEISGLIKPEVICSTPLEFFRGWKLFACTQEMASYISLDLARVRNKFPAYTPFIAPEVSASSWDVTSKGNTAALARWRTSARQAKREDNPHPIPMQAWLLYQLRFLISDD